MGPQPRFTIQGVRLLCQSTPAKSRFRNEYPCPQVVRSLSTVNWLDVSGRNLRTINHRTKQSSTFTRHASSSATTTSKPTAQFRKPSSSPREQNHAPSTEASSSQHTALETAKDKLNPPSFTYAPELSIPPREPDQSFFKYIWRAGRAYLSFYKAGVSNVRQTTKLARSLREKAAKSNEKDQTDVLTRSEWQVMRRNRMDKIRLPAFGLIFLVFGEWTPLLVMYITPLIPEPCRIPSQTQRELKKLQITRKDRLQRAAANAMRIEAKDRPALGSTLAYSTEQQTQIVSSSQTVRNSDPLKLPYYELLLASARYNCHTRLFDILRITPPKFWLQRGVRKHFTYLAKDDTLIERDGGFRALKKKEIERACVERGMDVLNKPEDELRSSLASWFRRS